METYHLTDKVKELIRNAEEISEGPVEPVDLFIGAALVKKGTLLEMYLLVEDDIHDFLVLNRSSEKVSVYHKDFSSTVTQRVDSLWNRALEIMTNYNQIYLNEGHVIKAFYQMWTPDEQEFLRGLPHDKIKESVTTARDLIVPMNTYSEREFTNNNVLIKRAGTGDRDTVLSFVIGNFGEGWAETLRNGFRQDEIPIFLAWKEERLIGFSSYDVYRDQKGIYGPMGVVKSERKSGVGGTLLHKALSDMKRKKYAYTILGEAGPIEYYEKECGAMLIPLSNV
ncbi:GNAT family N-acetyltransferase [Bacillus sp. SCS-153A]|uniref:GNAT family N-acetyltransferase n=1 Tax=Rossellomorea sedimentorum TaxID=3115294 RepID=UPI003905864F